MITYQVLPTTNESERVMFKVVKDQFGSDTWFVYDNDDDTKAMCGNESDAKLIVEALNLYHKVTSGECRVIERAR